MVGQKISTGPPAGRSGRNFGLNFWNRPQRRESEGFLGRKHESEELGETDGDVVKWSKRVCHLVKRTGTDLVNVRIRC